MAESPMAQVQTVAHNGRSEKLQVSNERQNCRLTTSVAVWEGRRARGFAMSSLSEGILVPAVTQRHPRTAWPTQSCTSRRPQEAGINRTAPDRDGRLPAGHYGTGISSFSSGAS